MSNNIILDLDGTVYIDNTIINNADKQIRRLKHKGFQIYYLTNNTSQNTKYYKRKLKKMNLPISKDSIISPIPVIIEWIRSRNYKTIYVLGVESLKKEIIEKTKVKINPKNAECVIIAFDKEYRYYKGQTADFKDVKSITIRRTKIEQWVDEPFFEHTI